MDVPFYICPPPFRKGDIMKVQVRGKTGHHQGDYFYPPGAELEITETMYKNMPDRFSPVLAKVEPKKIKEVKVPDKPLDLKDDITKGGVVKKTETVSNDEPEKFIPTEKESSSKDSYPFRIGGSWYRLSNRKKIQGKAKAIKAEKTLNG